MYLARTNFQIKSGPCPSATGEHVHGRCQLLFIRYPLSPKLQGMSFNISIVFIYLKYKLSIWIKYIIFFLASENVFTLDFS